MDQKEKQMVERIMDTEAIGYAYLYPAAGGQRKEYLISTTPKILQILSAAISWMPGR